MSLSRRGVIALVALIGAGAAAIAMLIPRLASEREPVSAVPSAGTGSRVAGSATPSTPTSEELIAAALKTGDITYEESLLARAYALHDDPRLAPSFRSPFIDWEAGTALLDEIDRKEAALTEKALADLAPFRVRPNDPISIYNRPREDVVRAQFSPPASWVSEVVPNSNPKRVNVRLWIKGPKEILKNRYVPLMVSALTVFEDFFPYPLPDDGNPTSEINPDGAIDVYLLDGSTLDPRWYLCRSAPYPTCTLGTVHGSSPSAEPKTDHTSSGYVRANLSQSDDELRGTIVHELAHVTQRKFDYREWEQLGNTWLPEASATWVAYKVLKQLGKVPQFEYDRLEELRAQPGRAPFLPIFKTLHLQLDEERRAYGSWLFFYHASMELGDRIVTRVWEAAAKPGVDGMDAVDEAIPLDLYFPRFTVRNWNKDPVIKQYKDTDTTFPSRLKPEPVVHFILAGSGTEELAEPVDNLAARYYRVTFANSVVRKLTFQNMFTDLKDAHVWAIKMIGTDWKEPEDWSRDAQKMFCRDSAGENLTELVLIVSNSNISNPLPSAHPKPRLLAEDAGCSAVEGTVKSTLRVKDAERDLTYVARATLRFRPRTIQETPGVVQYDLEPTTVTWTVSGKSGICTVAGQAVVRIPDRHDQPLDISLPAQGYLHAVGVDGGDWHGIEVNAFDPKARMKVTCPGDPPTVREASFDSVLLLHILSHPNSHDSKGVVYKGHQKFDPEKLLDNLPAIGRGVAESFPGVADALKKLPGGRTVYDFEWELRPLGGPAGGWTPPMKSN